MHETILHKAYGELVKTRNLPALLKGVWWGNLQTLLSQVDLREESDFACKGLENLSEDVCAK